MSKNIIYFLYDSNDAPSAALNHVELFVKGLNLLHENARIEKLKNPHTMRRGRILKIISIFFICIKVYIKYFMNENNTIILYGFNYLWPLLVLPRFCTIVVERNEYPDFMLHGCKTEFLEIKLMKKIDAVITCSDNLSKYYGGLCRNSTHIFISPVIVDYSFFSRSAIIEKKITYCGDWNNNKDGVDILIKAFCIFHKLHQDYRLELIGGGTEQTEQNLHNLCDYLNIAKYVDFIGKVSHKLMPDYLCSAQILALARPNNKQAQGGFPSKIAEYLSTKRNVVLTNVGDLHVYLKDGINCYMAEPDSAESFAEKLLEAVGDNNAMKIAESGYETAITFNYDIQAYKLKEFLYENRLI